VKITSNLQLHVDIHDPPKKPGIREMVGPLGFTNSEKTRKEEPCQPKALPKEQSRKERSEAVNRAGKNGPQFLEILNGLPTDTSL
jgi:hypothetical protein